MGNGRNARIAKGNETLGSNSTYLAPRVKTGVQKMLTKKQMARNVVLSSADEFALLLGLWFVGVFNGFPENVVVGPGLILRFIFT